MRDAWRGSRGKSRECRGHSDTAQGGDQMGRCNKLMLAVFVPGSVPVRTWTRHAEPTHPQSSPVRDLWLFGGIWNDLCRRAGLDRDAQTSIKRRHEPKDGDNHGRFSDPVGLLRLADCFATGDPMERGGGVGQFLERRFVPSFRPQIKKLSRKVSASAHRCSRSRIKGPPHIPKQDDRAGCWRSVGNPETAQRLVKNDSSSFSCGRG
jgi:hypothetical protein